MKINNLKGKKFGKLSVLYRGKNNKWGRTRWLCLCDCGRKKLVTGNNLLSSQGTRSCGCSKEKAPNFKNLERKVFGKLTVVRRNGSRNTRAKWLCQCECGNSTIICSKELLNGDTRSCGCLHSEKLIKRTWKGYGEIPMSYWRNVIHGAEIRSIQINITIEEAWNLFLKQDKKCALTNLPLSFGSKSKRLGIVEKTASLDRIDSKKGYESSNIQWVHKQIQKMKNNIPQNEFIEMCKLISNNPLLTL